MNNGTISEAVRVLKRGGVIALPTETTYGLACDPRNAKAVAKIFKIKGRNERKPLQLIASTFRQVEQLAALTQSERRLAKAHWPGPLTLLVRLKTGQKFPSRVNPKRIIGIRVTSSTLTRKLIQAYGYPIAATSANRSGSSPAFSKRGVERAFLKSVHRPDFILDGRALPRRKPSTVVRVKKDGVIEVLRRGSIRL
jgi:L-threonylcarbamoyladenylate synthase